MNQIYVGNYNTFYPTFLQNYRSLSVEASSLFPVVAAVAGVVSGTVAACTYSIIPVLAATPKKADFALAALSFFTALGKVLAGALVSPALVALGYQANALYICAPLALAAALLVAALVVSDKKVAALREQSLEPRDTQ